MLVVVVVVVVATVVLVVVVELLKEATTTRTITDHFTLVHKHTYVVLPASALLNSASSSCSSGSKDQRERATLSCVGRHQSMWWGTTHSNMRKRGGRADGAISNRSERKPYNTSFTSQLSSSIHCIPSHCNLVSFTSLSPFLSPSYITYAKGDDTVYYLAENR